MSGRSISPDRHLAPARRLPGVLYSLLLCMLEVVEGGFCLLEILEVICCVLFCTLEAEGQFCLPEVPEVLVREGYASASSF
jgi:hypothetical protein